MLAMQRLRRVTKSTVSRVKYWGIIADDLSRADWSLGWVSAIDSNGRTIWIVDAHRDDGKRFVVRADEKLTPFLELESATRALRRLFSQTLRFRLEFVVQPTG